MTTYLCKIKTFVEFKADCELSIFLIPNYLIVAIIYFVGGKLLFSSKLIVNSNQALLKANIPSRGFKATPCSSGALDYFRARRGPFTPGMKVRYK